MSTRIRWYVGVLLLLVSITAACEGNSGDETGAYLASVKANAKKFGIIYRDPPAIPCATPNYDLARGEVRWETNCQ